MSTEISNSSNGVAKMGLAEIFGFRSAQRTHLGHVSLRRCCTTSTHKLSSPWNYIKHCKP